MQIPVRLANIAGLLGWVMVGVDGWVGVGLARWSAMRCSRACSSPAWRALRIAGPRPAYSSLGELADAGVQPHAVVALLDDLQLGAQHGGIADFGQVGPFGFDVAEQRLDPGLVGGVPGRPKCWWMAHRAMNSRVEPEVIWGPLSLIASRMGRDGSSVVGSTRPSWRAVTSSTRPSRSSASVTTTSTWVEVSSAETMWASHLRLTRSAITVGPRPRGWSESCRKSR